MGMSEILLTLAGQLVLGNWFGEYRPLIPMIFLIMVLLIEPRGIQGLYERFQRRRTSKPTKEPEKKKEDEK